MNINPDQQEPTEREWLEGLRYEDKFPDPDQQERWGICPHCGGELDEDGACPVVGGDCQFPPNQEPNPDQQEREGRTYAEREAARLSKLATSLQQEVERLREGLRWALDKGDALADLHNHASDNPAIRQALDEFYDARAALEDK